MSRLRLTYAPAVTADVRAMVAAEQQCCAFLTFETQESREAIVPTITVPERAAKVTDDVVAQFMHGVKKPERGRRLLRWRPRLRQRQWVMRRRQRRANGQWFYTAGGTDGRDQRAGDCCAIDAPF